MKSMIALLLNALLIAALGLSSGTACLSGEDEDTQQIDNNATEEEQQNQDQEQSNIIASAMEFSPPSNPTSPSGGTGVSYNEGVTMPSSAPRSSSAISPALKRVTRLTSTSTFYAEGEKGKAMWFNGNAPTTLAPVSSGSVVIPGGGVLAITAIAAVALVAVAANDVTVVGILDDLAIPILAIVVIGGITYMVLNHNDYATVFSRLGAAIQDTRIVQQINTFTTLAQITAEVLDGMIRYRMKQLQQRLDSLKLNVCQVKCKPFFGTLCPWNEVVGLAGHLSPKMACLLAIEELIVAFPLCPIDVSTCTETIF